MEKFQKKLLGNFRKDFMDMIRHVTLQEGNSLLTGSYTLQEEHSLLTGSYTLQEKHSLLTGSYTLQ